ncbi:MAG TPA: integrase core domain-containing protein, partial [Candidatus Methylomirabilis sp.]|nr:integrase core domain-containing protein [Candidatus Methylomirabilis sp.]
MPWKTSCYRVQRWRFLREFLRKRNTLAELCRRWSISRKTAYKWICRFQERGRFGLADRQRVAQRVHNRPANLWLARIRRWRARHPSWGAPKLRWALERRFGRPALPSAAAIGRWLKEWGLVRRRRRPAHKGPVLERPRLTPAQRPNEVWTVDFKGWFRTGDGSRVEPLTIRDLASRYILGIILLRQQSVEATRRAFEEVFGQYGLPLIIRVDNGTPFGAVGALGLTRLSAWWVKLGIKVEFIDPGCPEQNGAHEQLHRVYQEEVAQPAAWSWRGQKIRTQRWQRHYNYERPHQALGMRVPAALYRKSPRKMPGRLGPWQYDPGWESRLVKGKGMISLDGRGRFIGEAFERERVGLKLSRPGVWEVYFGPLLIGELWDSELGGIRAAWYRKRR